MNRGAWQAVVYRVTKSWTRLNNFHFTSLHYTNKGVPGGSVIKNPPTNQEMQV